MVITEILLVIAIALVPALAWLLLFLKEDEHPEPTMLLVKTFAMGMLASVPALVLQVFIQKLFTDPAITFASTVFLFAAAEELFKFLGVYAIINNHPDFDEPVDGMIYMVVAGLGFATVENLFIIFALMRLSNGTRLLDASQEIVLRLVGATLLHVLASAIVGYYWSKGIIKNSKWHFILIGLMVAILVHGAFNYLVHEFQDINIFFPTIFLVGVSFFIFSDFEKLKDVGS